LPDMARSMTRSPMTTPDKASFHVLSNNFMIASFFSG
jgi:hypothetical protein